MFKVIIAGGRDFADYALLEATADHLLSKKTDVEIVSGGARGADLLGEHYAGKLGFPVKQFLPNWGRFGRSAGYKRNGQMAAYADALIAFWDGSSRGTSHMIDLAQKAGLQIRVIRYKE